MAIKNGPRPFLDTSFVIFKKEVSVKMEKDVFDLNNPHDVMAEAQRRIDCPKVWKRVGEEYKPKIAKLVCKVVGGIC